MLTKGKLTREDRRQLERSDAYFQHDSVQFHVPKRPGFRPPYRTLPGFAKLDLMSRYP